ncbi:MAG TPA: MarR family transcriptional regulator [Anaerolineae bacterium]
MDDELYLGMLNWFAALDRRSLADFHHFTHAAGLTMQQMHLLMYLHSHGPCTMGALVEATSTSKAAISQMVDRLEQQKLVERAEAPADRRAKLVTLTRKGKRVMDESMRARQDWLKRAGEMLTTQQKLQVTEALHTLTEAAARAEGCAPARADDSAHTPRSRAAAERKYKKEE